MVFAMMAIQRTTGSPHNIDKYFTAIASIESNFQTNYEKCLDFF